MMTDKLKKDVLKIKQAPGEIHLPATMDKESPGLPNFFIDTILKKLPAETANHENEQETSSHASWDSYLSKSNKLPGITNGFQTVSDFFHTGSYYSKYVQLHFPLQAHRLLQTQRNQFQPNFFESQELNFANKLANERNFYHWQQNLFSTISKNEFVNNSELRGRLNIADVQKPFNFNPAVVHFGNHKVSTLNVNIGESQSICPSKLPQTADKFSPKNSEGAIHSSVRAADILLQLNEMSEKLPVCNQTAEHNATKFSILSQQKLSDSITYNLETSSQESCPSRATKCPEENPPAWVFCTRYSDRPCAGPRIKRTKKDFRKRTATNLKRERTAFSETQLTKLQKEFKDCPYLTEERRINLSSDLGLSIAQIKVWFQNKRAKVKKASGVQSRLKMSLIASGIYEHGTIMPDDND